MQNLKLFLDGRSDRLVLKTLAKVHIATKKQLHAFLAIANPEQTEAEQNTCFNNLIKLDLLSVKRCRIQSGLGEIRTRSGCPTVAVDIYFLTEYGVATADTIYKGFGRFARGGEPAGVNEARIYHDLLICEAFLHACSVYNVTDFVTEAQLKSEIFHGRSAYKTAENTGDFRVQYLRHDGVPDSFVGEVILQSKKEQLQGKPSNIVFYTDCQQTADKIQEFKNTGAFIFKNVLNIPKEINTKPAESFTTLEHKIMELFDGFSIALDAETVGLLLKIHRANVSSALYNLVQKNVFTYQFLNANGRRPIKLYGYKNLRHFDDYLVRKLYFSYSLLLRLIIKNNSNIEEFNVENSTITIKHLNGKRMEILIDNLQNSIEENVRQFNKMRSLNISRVDGMKMFIQNSERFETAGKLLSSMFLLNSNNQ